MSQTRPIPHVPSIPAAVRCGAVIMCLAAASFAIMDFSPKPLSGANNDLGVKYLPDSRYAGTKFDEQSKLNVHWPTDGKLHPCVIVVHGGGYGDGDKDEALYNGVCDSLVRSGFVAANLNYILGRGIYPQVYWDFRAAVRFLRKNAAKYGIDVDHIGAWGFSAGGWLITSGSYPNAQHEIDCNSILWMTRDQRKNNPMRLSMDDPHPVWGEYSSRVQVLTFDFSSHTQFLGFDAPATCTYRGRYTTSGLAAPCSANGIDFLDIELLNTKYDYRDYAHVPSLATPVVAEDGVTPSVLSRRVVQWFDMQLRRSPRLPCPEFRPNCRYFDDSVMVSMVVPSSSIKIHFTTDSTAPSMSSRLYTGPFTARSTTVIRAISVRGSERTSGVAMARFILGGAPPAIQPLTPLYRAKVGIPVAFAFAARAAAGRKVRWNLEGQLATAWSSGQLVNDCGVHINDSTGALYGTPRQAGTYLLCVQAAHGFRMIADQQTALLVIDSAATGTSMSFRRRAPLARSGRPVSLSLPTGEHIPAAQRAAAMYSVGGRRVGNPQAGCISLKTSSGPLLGP